MNSKIINKSCYKVRNHNGSLLHIYFYKDTEHKTLYMVLFNNKSLTVCQ